MSQQLYTGGSDHSEHHDGSTAKNSLGHGRDQRPQFGNQPGQHQKDGADRHHMAADHPGKGHHADVLGIGGVGQGAKNRGQRCARPIGHDTAGKLLVGGFAARTADGDAGDVSHRFDGGDQGHDTHTQQGGHIKIDTKF